MTRAISLGDERKNGVSAQTDQGATEFGLEDHNQTDGEEGEEAVVEQTDALEDLGTAQHAGSDADDDAEQQQALHAPAARVPCTNRTMA